METHEGEFQEIREFGDTHKIVGDQMKILFIKK